MKVVPLVEALSISRAFCDARHVPVAAGLIPYRDENHGWRSDHCMVQAVSGASLCIYLLAVTSTRCDVFLPWWVGASRLASAMRTPLHPVRVLASEGQTDELFSLKFCNVGSDVSTWERLIHATAMRGHRNATCRQRGKLPSIMGETANCKQQSLCNAGDTQTTWDAVCWQL